jgi:hypothetical protein
VEVNSDRAKRSRNHLGDKLRIEPPFERHRGIKRSEQRAATWLRQHVETEEARREVLGAVQAMGLRFSGSWKREKKKRRESTGEDVATEVPSSC